MTYGPVNGVMSELVYDCQNRLVSAGGVTYTYDAENNRIAMESERHKETYVVDTVSGSLSRILTITEGSGTNADGGKTTTLCIYGQGLICEKTGDIYRYHHYNNLGSTMKLTDAKGGVTASFTYGTYGELLSGSTGYTRFLYNGRCGVMTDDNGFYYRYHRLAWCPEAVRLHIGSRSHSIGTHCRSPYLYTEFQLHREGHRQRNRRGKGAALTLSYRAIC